MVKGWKFKNLSFLNSAMFLNYCGELIVVDGARNVADIEPPRCLRHRGLLSHREGSPKTALCGEKGSQVGGGGSQVQENVCRGTWRGSEGKEIWRREKRRVKRSHCCCGVWYVRVKRNVITERQIEGLILQWESQRFILLSRWCWTSIFYWVGLAS